MIQLSFIHIVNLSLTLLLVTIVGIVATQKVKNIDDFTVGGNASGPVLVSGTIVGGSVTIGTAQLAYVFG